VRRAGRGTEPATVAAAAGRAFAGGARREAVELGEHALRLTPAGSPGWPERLLTLADYLETAGEADRLKELLTANLDSIPGGPVRARASVLLAEVLYERLDDYRQHLERARVEAQAGPALHALIVARMSSAAISVDRIADAEARALAVLPAAEQADPEVERAVLFALAWARALSGRALDDVCDRWNAASATPGHLTSVTEPLTTGPRPRRHYRDLSARENVARPAEVSARDARFVPPRLPARRLPARGRASLAP